MLIQKDNINNFRLLHIKKDSPISFVLFLVKNGSRYETPQDSGISHFIEHMMFKQTKSRTTKQISTEIETIGGQANAFTSYEYTGYYIKVLREKFGEAFEILADILQNGKFLQEDIDIERGNIIEEIRMYEDSPADLVGQISQQNVFPEQKLGQMIIGTEETVNSFNRQDLVNYIDSNYLQDDFLIVSVGNFNIDYTKEQVNKFLKPRKSGKLKVDKSEFSPKQKVNFVEKASSKQAHVVISFPGISSSNPDLHKFEVVDEVLGHGMGSILMDLLREKLGVAYYVGSNHSDYLDTGVFQIYFGSNNDKTQMTVDKVFEELEKMKTKEISKEELERAQNLFFSSIAMAHENIGYLGQKYGIEYLLEDKIETLEEVKLKIYSVNFEDIKETAKKIFTDNYNITYIANKELIK